LRRRRKRIRRKMRREGEAEWDFHEADYSLCQSANAELEMGKRRNI